ncbi:MULTISPECIES: Fur family transcriptional regulator [unclassified Serinicoccus]|uniref:Fur family transcriptional regulator n=1 Tax=unclassified Serinicoccus TaxID=2643101 RepID=UPI0038547F52
MSHAPDLSAALGGAGLRVTGPRVAVLRTLHDHPHADAADLVRLTRQHDRGISVQGVYDVLGRLTESGLVRRIQPAHSVARYELDQGDNHHHVVCRGCGTLVDVPCSTGARPCLDPGPDLPSGFQLDEAEVIYWGRCPGCRATTASPSIPTPKEKA